jgi:mRNA-degrading endonuclease RelE of RelBE toxin-antitoxin system
LIRLVIWLDGKIVAKYRIEFNKQYLKDLSKIPVKFQKQIREKAHDVDRILAIVKSRNEKDGPQERWRELYGQQRYWRKLLKLLEGQNQQRPLLNESTIK